MKTNLQRTKKHNILMKNISQINLNIDTKTVQDKHDIIVANEW